MHTSSLFLLLLFTFFTIRTEATVIGRRAAMGSLAAFLSGVGSVKTPAETSLPASDPSRYPPALKAWRLTQIPQTYDVLKGTAAKDENLFFVAAKSGPHPTGLSQLRERYRRAIVSGGEVEGADPLSLTSLRSRVALDATVRDKYAGDFGRHFFDLEEGLVRDLRSDPVSVANAAEVALQPRKLVSLALSGGLTQDGRPALYSRRFLTEFVQRLFAFSPPLALRAAESSRVNLKDSRRWFLAELGLSEFPGWTRQYFRFVHEAAPAIYDRDLHKSEEHAAVNAMMEHYLAALQKLAVAQRALKQMDSSPLTQIALNTAATLETELTFELRTLQPRIVAWRLNIESPDWASRDWFNFNPGPASLVDTAITTAEWVRTVNVAIVGAGMIVPLFVQADQASVTSEEMPELVEPQAEERCEPLLLAAPVPTEPDLIFTIDPAFENLSEIPLAD